MGTITFDRNDKFLCHLIYSSNFLNFWINIRWIFWMCMYVMEMMLNVWLTAVFTNWFFFFLSLSSHFVFHSTKHTTHCQFLFLQILLHFFSSLFFLGYIYVHGCTNDNRFISKQQHASAIVMFCNVYLCVSVFMCLCMCVGWWCAPSSCVHLTTVKPLHFMVRLPWQSYHVPLNQPCVPLLLLWHFRQRQVYHPIPNKLIG